MLRRPRRRRRRCYSRKSATSWQRSEISDWAASALTVEIVDAARGAPEKDQPPPRGRGFRRYHRIDPEFAAVGIFGHFGQIQGADRKIAKLARGSVDQLMRPLGAAGQTMTSH